jgi:hypothetical protein
MNRIAEWVQSAPGIDVIGPAALGGGKWSSVAVMVAVIVSTVIRGACGG